MTWGETDEERFKRLTTARLWFAWHPVRLRDGRFAWLEKVWRWREAYHNEVSLFWSHADRYDQ
jgi:hypothetical protein